ncbi:ATP-dependent permease MDL2 [Cordyceps fumosorosea ARSEF 2679]|uniref:ATP-dependent permease MDL2 n=1 Tax=Cordyceps fumosorosea (strain ARSEF 2679) TaxID=1081104 RepID=A0A167RMA3_CORFA|nr:ATP-dependent permease MDL2 [Cordyceps fumosorosea ARSEF 2679]OAA58734.1 ATP-dependent permease MDL2 [Cordyceps fumosorosea ARSEF 2679]
MSSLLPWTVSVARQHARITLQRSTTSSQVATKSISTSAGVQSQQKRHIHANSGARRQSSPIGPVRCSLAVARVSLAPRAAAALPRSLSTTSTRAGQAVAKSSDSKAVRKDTEDDEDALVDEVGAKASKGPKHAAQLSKNEPDADNSAGGLLRLLSIARPEAKPLGLATVFLAVSATITMTIPYAVGRIIDAAGKGGIVEVAGHAFTLTQFIVGMGAVLTLGSAASFTRNVMMRIIGERVIARLRSRLYRRTYTQDAEFFDVNPVGDLISRLGSDVNIVGDSVTTSVTYALRSTFNTVAGIAIMLWTSAKLTMLMLVILPPMAIGSLIYGRFVERMSKRVQKNLGTLTKIAEERLGNVRTSQAFVGERQEVHRYNNQIRKVFALRKREGIVTSTFYTSTLWAGNISFLIMLTVGNGFIQSGAMTTGDLTAFVMYAMFAGTGMMDFFYTYTEIMRGSGAAQRLFELSDKRPRIAPSRGLRVASAAGAVKFTDVHFAYPTRPDATIFNGLSFTIPAGANACIVGPSGRGKSTVGALLLRFYDPVSGTISIGGQDVSKMSAQSLRRRIGVVAQEPALFSGTVAENIAYGVPGASEAEVARAAAIANCTFVEELPRGLATQVGARGSQLSGGQRQRVAIARAVLKRPDVLVLDEATSALDAESEALVNEALGRVFAGGMTTVAIAHRRSTIEKADLLIVLGGDGRVAETGTYAELAADKDSEFSKLMENQMRSPVVRRPVEDGEGITAEEEEVIEEDEGQEAEGEHRKV